MSDVLQSMKGIDFVFIFMGMLLFMGFISGLMAERFPVLSDIIGIICMSVSVLYWFVLVIMGVL